MHIADLFFLTTSATAAVTAIAAAVKATRPLLHPKRRCYSHHAAVAATALCATTAAAIIAAAIIAAAVTATRPLLQPPRRCYSHRGRCHSHHRRCQSHRRRCHSHHRRCQSYRRRCQNHRCHHPCSNNRPSRCHRRRPNNVQTCTLHIDLFSFRAIFPLFSRLIEYYPLD